MSSEPLPGSPFPAVDRVEAPVVKDRSSRAGAFVNLLLGLAVVVAAGGVAFAAGRATAPAAVASGNGAGRFGNGGPFGGPAASGAPNGEFGGRGGGFNAGLGNGGISVEGTVTAVSATSITLQLTGGQTVTVPIDAQTTFHERAAATAADVTSGSTVIVQLQGARGVATGNGNGNGNNGNGNGNGGPVASGQPARTLPVATSITLVPAGS